MLTKAANRTVATLRPHKEEMENYFSDYKFIHAEQIQDLAI